MHMMPTYKSSPTAMTAAGCRCRPDTFRAPASPAEAATLRTGVRSRRPNGTCRPSRCRHRRNSVWPTACSGSWWWTRSGWCRVGGVHLSSRCRCFHPLSSALTTDRLPPQACSTRCWSWIAARSRRSATSRSRCDCFPAGCGRSIEPTWAPSTCSWRRTWRRNCSTVSATRPASGWWTGSTSCWPSFQSWSRFGPVGSSWSAGTSCTSSSIGCTRSTVSGFNSLHEDSGQTKTPRQ